MNVTNPGIPLLASIYRVARADTYKGDQPVIPVLPVDSGEIGGTMSYIACTTVRTQS